MTKKELEMCFGGALSITSLINSVVKIGNFFVETGRSIGSAIRYISSGKKCKV